jgi:hypothetical protein
MKFILGAIFGGFYRRLDGVNRKYRWNIAKAVWRIFLLVALCVIQYVKSPEDIHAFFIPVAVWYSLINGTKNLEDWKEMLPHYVTPILVTMLIVNRFSIELLVLSLLAGAVYPTLTRMKIRFTKLIKRKDGTYMFIKSTDYAEFIIGSLIIGGFVI